MVAVVTRVVLSGGEEDAAGDPQGDFVHDGELPLG